MAKRHTDAEIRELLRSLYISERPYWNGVVTSADVDENVERVRRFLDRKKSAS